MASVVKQGESVAVAKCGYGVKITPSQMRIRDYGKQQKDGVKILTSLYRNLKTGVLG